MCRLWQPRIWHSQQGWSLNRQSQAQQHFELCATARDDVQTVLESGYEREHGLLKPSPFFTTQDVDSFCPWGKQTDFLHGTGLCQKAEKSVHLHLETVRIQHSPQSVCHLQSPDSLIWLQGFKQIFCPASCIACSLHKTLLQILQDFLENW